MPGLEEVMQTVDKSDTARLLEWAQGWLKEERGHYIDGAWLYGADGDSDSESIPSIDPSTGRKLCEIRQAGSREVDAAVAAARKAFADRRWRSMPRRERSRLLMSIAELIREHSAELAALEALDNGKLFKEAINDDLPEAADVFDYYAGWTDKHYSECSPQDEGFINYTVHEPLGVCALIVPWNFPLLLAMWKIAPALAMGNTVVVKPSPFTSLSILRFFELLHQKIDNLPEGVINLVTGGAETGRLLCEHMGVDKVSFTGSTATGKAVVASSAASNLKQVSLELGGKSPNIVFDDVPDLDFAIERSYAAMFSHKGEKCSEPTRLFVHKKIHDQFVARLVDIASGVKCGAQFDESADQGSQCNQEQFDKIMRYIEIGKSEGGRIVVGGERDTRGENARGLFVRPTIFTDVDNRMKVSRDEIFGPVLVVIPFASDDEVIEMANDSIYGLAAGLWTRDVSRAHTVAGRLDAGMVFINRFGCYDFASPFGGFKQSGWGKEMAVHSLAAYTRLKSIWLKL